MKHHGLPVPRDRVAQAALTEEGGFLAMRGLLGIRRPPTAVVASSFAAAVGAMSAIAVAGGRVPDDVSIVAFHDAPIGEYLNPRLTTVRMPLAQMAEAAVDTLCRLIEGEKVTDLVINTPEPMLVQRDSAASPPAP
jgi:LacI family transcriptional regulator